LEKAMQTDDRIVVLEDEKARILDLTSFKFVPPSEGIYEGTVRYYKANLKWAKIIEGFVSWLATVAAWPEAQNENYHAIQQILIFLEGVEPEMSIDYEAWYDANKRAMYDALNDLAKQIVSGRVTNISVDEDGVVSDPSTGTPDAELPEDDPETPINEGDAALMGAAINVSKALEVLFDKLDNYYGATNGAPVTSAITVTLYLSLYFPVDGDTFGDAVQAYYGYRDTNNRLIWDTSEGQQNVLFCQGANLTGWNKWLIDYSGFSAEKISVMSQLTNALAPAFWTNYFNDGLELPSSQYLDAPCVPIDPQTLENLVFAVQRSTSIVKANHRMRIRVEGYATDTDGDIQDWFWFRTAAGVNTFTTPTFTHSAGSNLPSQTEVAYSPSHIYEYTVDLANLANNPILITLNKHANLNATGLVYTVPFKITLTDLGQHTII
jgi:hypothetical protein